MNIHQVLLAGYGASGGGGGGGDYPPFANQVVGLHFNGTDGSNTFTDVTGASFSALGTPKPEIDTAQSQFGGASGLFSGTGYLQHAGASRYAYGTGNFVWAGWTRFTTASGNQYILDHNANGGLITYTGSVLRYFNPTTGAGSPLYTGGGSLTLNVWQYIEVSRVSGTTYLFVDGTLRVSAADSYNYPNSTLSFGVFGGGGNNLNNAHLDDWGIWKGVGGHTSSYTPPPSPFPDS